MARLRRGLSTFLLSSGALWAAAILAIVSIAALTLKLAASPMVLKVAVGPDGSADAKLMAAVAKQFGHGRSRLRLVVVPTEGPAESAAAIDQGKADLAVVRSDVAMPDKGSTVVVLHKDAAILLAPAGAKIRKIADLAGKRVGIVRGLPANSQLLDAILTQYGVPPASVRRVLLQPEEAGASVRDKRVDAVLVVSPPTGSLADMIVADVSQSATKAPVFIDIGEAEAMAQRQPIYEKTEIVSGSFRGNPARPAEPFNTLGITYRLVASQDLADGTVTDLVKALLSMRKALEAEAPLAVRMEAPETEKGSAFPLHPGASAYYDNNEKTFMDRYGDLIYVAAMLLGGIGSAIAGLFGAAEARARRAAMALVVELIAVKDQAHGALDLHELAELSTQIDAISTRALTCACQRRFNTAGLEALRLAMDEARLAVGTQRARLAAADAVHAHAETESVVPLTRHDPRRRLAYAGR
jgi:TRAP transporter TAXI family solute receptor